MKFIGFDIETASDCDRAYGLQPYRVRQGTARITAASLVTEDGEVLFSKLEPQKTQLCDIFIYAAYYSLKCDTDICLIGWNTPFDASWLIAMGLEEMLREFAWADGQVYRRALENNSSPDQQNGWGLKASVAKYLPEYAGYESEVAGNFDVIDEKLLDYNKLDAHLTARLGRIFWDKLTPKERTLCTVINAAILPFAKSWVNGITLDKAKIELWNDKIEADLVTHFDALSETGVTAKQLASPVQLKRFLNESGVGVASTNKTELSKHKDNSIVKSVLDYKEARTASTKFIAGMLDSLEYNDSETTHPNARLWNTYTGRVGYASKQQKKYPVGIAIHQFPRKKEARDCVVAPEGFLLAEYDFSTQESRLLCDYSGDETLYKIFNDGLDFHTYMAAQIAELKYEVLKEAIADGDPEAKNYRQLAKVANLSCAYRTGWKKLTDVARTQYNVALTEQMAHRLHSLFRSTYRRVPEYWDAAVRSAKMHGFAETRGGRKVYIDDWSHSNAWAAESTAINFPIQGTGADQKFLAIATIEPLVHQNGGSYLLDLHDALFLLIPDNSHGEEFARDLRIVLSNLPYEQVYGWKPKVNFPVDLKLGRRWGSLTEIKD